MKKARSLLCRSQSAMRYAEHLRATGGDKESVRVAVLVHVMRRAQARIITKKRKAVMP